MNNEINIARRFESVAAAVAAAKIDLSYNEALAKQQISDLDLGYRGCRAVSAFISPENVVYYVYAAEGLRLLHRFEPFHGCLSDGSLRIGRIDGDTVLDLNVGVPNTPKARRALAEVFASASDLVILPR